jgi:hypothetical protein
MLTSFSTLDDACIEGAVIDLLFELERRSGNHTILCLLLDYQRIKVDCDPRWFVV